MRTPSGKIDLAPPVLLVDLVRIEADATQAPPELVIIGRRDLRSNNSWMHNLPVLAKGPDRCTALVHPDDAVRLSLNDGQMARITTATADHERSIDIRVKVSDTVMPGVVSVPHGWGHDLANTRMRVAARRPGVNLNHLLDENWRDPLSGNAVLSGIPVRIEAIPATGIEDIAK